MPMRTRVIVGSDLIHAMHIHAARCPCQTLLVWKLPTLGFEHESTLKSKVVQWGFEAVNRCDCDFVTW